MEMKNKKRFWKDYWDKQSDGQHHLQEEQFLKEESDEKLFHLAKGGNLLDFGCGSADLLVYYTPFFKFSLGADGSNLMLQKAKERLSAFNNQDNVMLINSDNYLIWSDIDKLLGTDFQFDCISTGQVMQYLDRKEIEDFISNAARHLSDNGKICLFDIVDSRRFSLWKAGLFKSNSLNFTVIMKLIINYLRCIVRKLKGKPFYDLGYVYPPSFFMELAQKNNLTASYYNSMFYDYRYHIVMGKKDTV